MPATTAVQTRTKGASPARGDVTPWGDRFQVPSVQDLLGSLDASSRKATKHLIAELEALPATSRSLRWHGVWGWTIVVRANADAECSPLPGRGVAEGPALAYVVCNPAGPMVSVPIGEDRLATLSIRKLTKRVREGIGQSPPVLGVRWPTWSVSASEAGDDVVALAAMMLEAKVSRGA